MGDKFHAILFAVLSVIFGAGYAIFRDNQFLLAMNACLMGAGVAAQLNRNNGGTPPSNT